MDNRFSTLTRRAFVGSTALVASGAAAAADQIAQTATSMMGPFYPIERFVDDDADLTWIKGHEKRAIGNVVEVSGRVLDRHGNPMINARLELWQANAAGRYAHANDISKMPLDPNFQGYAALVTGNSGEWRIITVKPAAYDSPIGQRTPHIHFDVQGKSHRLTAQMYFSDDAATNVNDMLYKELGRDAQTSVARLDSTAKYRWDIVLMDG